MKTPLSAPEPRTTTSRTTYKPRNGTHRLPVGKRPLSAFLPNPSALKIVQTGNLETTESEGRHGPDSSSAHSGCRKEP